MMSKGRAEKRVERRPGRKRSPRTALFRLVLTVAPDVADVAGALLVRAGAGGAMQEELPRAARVSCFGESQAVLERLGRVVAARLDGLGARAAYRVARAPRKFDAWRTAWTLSLEPVRISADTWLVPTHAAAPDGAKDSVIWLEPSLSFGFGEHPTTRMAARVVERLCRDQARRVLDFGTGSGVLSLVAAHAGATRVTGLDVDPAAVAAARGNAARNGLERRCRFSRAPLGKIRAIFDVVVANVDRATLTERAGALATRVGADGHLVLTGFLEEDVHEIVRMYRERGFRVTKRVDEAGFTLLSLSRTAGPLRALDRPSAGKYGGRGARKG